ncbi:oxidoreductase [Planotetraspora kaengkrachanensis]|uniref:Oxidoreductase n=1 Tax=Planotetraspora kaengkrachanensis TaxID=575193 RepID=A0A8J3PUT9_9ACTN|nr:oxidoreductase [Planotetraspora kaengkrachanensis]
MRLLVNGSGWISGLIRLAGRYGPGEGRSLPFRDLNAAERRVWEAYPTGTPVDLRDGKNDDPAEGHTWARGRAVRAEVLAALLLGISENQPGRVPGIRLAGAHIVGDLNLSDAVVTSRLHLLGCHIPGIVSLNDARTRGVRLRRCHIGRFRAGRATIDGLLDLDGSTIENGVRLDNCHVTGQFRMSRAVVGSPSVPSRGGGTEDLPGWSQPYNAGRDSEPVTQVAVAVWAGGLTVDGGAFLRGLRTTGGLRFIGAHFNSGLYLEGAVLSGTDGHAVFADHLQATAAEFSQGFTATGAIRLRGARISGVLSFDKAALKAQGRVLHLSHMQVDELILLPDSVEGGINLGYSRIGVLFDRPDCYPENVHLNGTTYESLRGPAVLADRLSWLNRDPDGYRPQPYEQLSAYYRRIGHESESRRVLLAKQRARRRTLKLPGRVWGRLLDIVVGYGYRPWLAGLWVGLLLAAGTSVFSHWRPHQIGLDESRSFNAFTYTIDLLAPVSVFEQRGAWEPVGWTQWLANGLIVAGWILATALIAGGTRVLRPSNTS